MDILYIIIQGE